MAPAFSRPVIVAARPLALVLLFAAAAPTAARAQSADEKGVFSAPTAARAQSADEKAVVSVIERFFAGMLARDTAMMSSTVDPAARLLGVSSPEGGQPAASATEMSGFIAGMAGRQGEGANERIHNPEVRIDGDLAAVWTFYTLHVGERFIHCGYDAFQLLRLPDGWKIVSVADTRRTEGCDVPTGRQGVR